MIKSGIYGFINIINNKWYIGQTNNLLKRKNNHLSLLRRGKHFNEHLQSSFDKYGENSFEFRILEETTEDMLDNREEAWIKNYKSNDPSFGYNYQILKCSVRHHSEESILKMSKSHKTYKPTEETKKKISKSLNGIKKSKETRYKMSLWKRTEEMKIKMSNARKKYYDLKRKLESVRK